MNVEFRFLQKAIQDKNYLSFNYENKKYNNIKGLKIDIENRFYCKEGIFKFEKMSKIQILKSKF